MLSTVDLTMFVHFSISYSSLIIKLPYSDTGKTGNNIAFTFPFPHNSIFYNGIFILVERNFTYIYVKYIIYVIYIYNSSNSSIPILIH